MFNVWLAFEFCNSMFITLHVYLMAIYQFSFRAILRFVLGSTRLFFFFSSVMDWTIISVGLRSI